MPQDFVAMFAGFGFATAAGLNAWVTLFLVSVAGRLGFLTLAQPYDIMSSWPIMAFLFAMMLIEGLADKIAGLDHISHLLHTVLQPIAGAILFASQAGIITEMSPVLAFVVGAMVAGTIHAARATVRPAVTVATAGLGNAVVSAGEDAAAITITIATILVPVLAAVAIVCVVVLLVWLWHGRRARTHG
jgi:hypothetical protein